MSCQCSGFFLSSQLGVCKLVEKGHGQQERLCRGCFLQEIQLLSATICVPRAFLWDSPQDAQAGAGKFET